MKPALYWTILTLAGSLLTASNAALSLRSVPQAQAPTTSWQAGEVIVKFRPAADPHLARALFGADLPFATLPECLRSLHQTNSIATVRPVAHPAWATRLPAGSSLHGSYVVRLSSKQTDIPAVCRDLARDPAIEYVEPNYQLSASFVPDDPFFSSAGSWGQAYDDQWGLKIAQVPAAWDLVVGSNDIVVAVVDSGIDFTHPDLQGRIAANGWNFLNNTADPTDDFGHGTFCAGIIAAVVNNSVGMAGVCPTAKILPLKFLDSTGHGYTDQAASAIDYAFNQGARIFNLSFSGPDSQTLQHAVDAAHNNNAVLVACAGNNTNQVLEYPAAYRNVITVGATDHSDLLADFSNFGPRIDVVAPGGDSGGTAEGYSILSLRAANSSPGTPLDSLYTRWRGSSFSAAFVSGVVALMRTHRPQLQMERIRQILRTTADDVMEPGWDWQTGYGRVNAFAALQPTNAVITLITSPANLQFTAGTLDVIGTAYGIPFAWSVVEWGYGWAPTNWTLLVSNSARLYNTTLASWDTTQVPDGEYTVRLRSADPDDHRYEDRVAVSVYNQLYNFDPPQHPGWPQPSGGANATAPLMANLDRDGKQELLWGVRHAMVVKRENGSNYTGWPQPIPGSPRGPASVADLDGDGLADIGIISDGDSFYPGEPDTIFLWHADGHPVSGWPKTFDPVDFNAYHFLSPVFADIDGDGVKEVIWYSCGTNGSGAYPATMVHVDRVNGSALPGWPLVLPGAAARTSTAPAVGDVDGDGRLDIVLVTHNGWLYPLHHNGQVFEGWPIIVVGGGWGTRPALADIDHDGHLEILAVTDGGICCYRRDGTLMPGWPGGAYGISGPAAFGDLDEDCRLETAAVLSGDRIGAFRADGTLLPGWPPKYGGGGFWPPIIADLDGDGHLDVASADWNGYVRAWNATGNELYHMGFPIKASTDTCYSGPVVGDVAGNGRLSLIVTGSDNDHGTIYDLWDLGTPYDPSRAPWPTMQGDNTHQSRYHVPPALFSVSPAGAAANEPAQLTVSGDFYLKGMRVLVGGIPQPVISETVTSIVFQFSAALPQGRYDLTVSNVNSSATTLPRALAVVSSGGDDDHDSLPNGWESQHGLDPFDDGTLNPHNGALGDPDHDGASNLAEFVAGTDPRDAVSVFALKSAAWSPAGGVAISWSSVAGKQYAVYRSGSVSGPFNIVTNGLPGSPPENRYVDDAACDGGPWFYRVAVAQ